MTPRRRDKYADVGAASRWLIRRANHANPPLKPTEMRVVLAIIELTTTWSKLSSYESHDQIRHAAGLKSRKIVGRTLRALVGRGLIIYKPGRGRGNLSKIGLLPHPEKWARTDPLLDGEKGARAEPKRGRVRDLKGTRLGGEMSTPEDSPRAFIPEDGGEGKGTKTATPSSKEERHPLAAGFAPRYRARASAAAAALTEDGFTGPEIKHALETTAVKDEREPVGNWTAYARTVAQNARDRPPEPQPAYMREYEPEPRPPRLSPERMREIRREQELAAERGDEGAA